MVGKTKSNKTKRKQTKLEPMQEQATLLSKMAEVAVAESKRLQNGHDINRQAMKDK